jgi:hypothetical protein
MVTLTEMPESIARLPRDERGYPVPWFVAWPGGKPEFRCADAKKFALAVRKKRCWVCGEPLDPKQHVFVIGPMCAVNRVTSEPPSHAECAIFSACNCPFLSKPKAQYRDAGMPEESVPPPGMIIMRNPGVTCLWYCRGYQLFQAHMGTEGYLFRIPFPAMVRWYAEGRKATRAEIMASIETGLPTLHAMAEKQGPEAVAELRRVTGMAMKLVPAA